MPRALLFPEKTATTVLLNQSDKNRLQEAAAQNGEPLSRYIRHLILASLPQ